MLVSITVRALQEGLFVLAHEASGTYYPGPVDGRWGPQTRLALMRFQTDQGRGTLNAGLLTFSDGVSGILIDSSISTEIVSAARDYAPTVARVGGSSGGRSPSQLQAQAQNEVNRLRDETAVVAALRPPASAGERSRWGAMLLGLTAATLVVGGGYYFFIRRRGRGRRRR